MGSSYTVDSHGVGICVVLGTCGFLSSISDRKVEPLSPFLTVLNCSVPLDSDLPGQDTVPITSVPGAWRGGTGIFLKSPGFPQTGWTAQVLSRNEHSSKFHDYT